MRFGTLNAKSLCRAGLLKTVASELVGIKVRGYMGGTESADDYIFLWKWEC